MPIDRLTQQDAFAPEDVREMTDAYRNALRGVTEIIAKKIVEAAKQGVTGADTLCELALRDLGLKRSAKPKRPTNLLRNLRRGASLLN
jgi:hypothetical protein